MEKLEGVKSAKVSHPEKQGVIRYEAGKVSLEQMITAIKSVGFTATTKKKALPVKEDCGIKNAFC